MPPNPDPSAGINTPGAGMPAIAIVVSKYNATVTDKLLAGAKAEYERRGGSEWRLGIFEVPGTFELPAMAGIVSRLKGWGGVVCLGCVIKGETTHDEVISNAVATALANLATRTGVPVGFGVITANDADQALARAGGDKGNKGAEAMAAVLGTMRAMADIRQGAEARNPGVRSTLEHQPDDKAGGA